MSCTHNRTGNEPLTVLCVRCARTRKDSVKMTEIGTRNVGEPRPKIQLGLQHCQTHRNNFRPVVLFPNRYF